MSGEVLAVGRSADGIAMEIRVIVQQTRTMMATAVIEVGKRLIEAQKLVPHGEWGEYVTHSCGFSQRTAQAYMQLAANPGNAQTFADLPYSKALALLALPEGTAEDFRAEHPVEDLSVRELKKQVSEYKDRLEKAANAGKAQQQQLLLATEENGALKQRLEGIYANYQAQLDAADRENDQLRADLKAAKKRPAEISAEDAEKLRSEGMAKGLAEGMTEQARLEGQVAGLKKQLEDQAASAESDKRDALAEKDARIAELERQLAAAAGPGSNAELVKSETLAVLAEVQAALNKMHGCYLKAQAGSPKLAGAIKAQAEKLIASLHSNFDIGYV